MTGSKVSHFGNWSIKLSDGTSLIQSLSVLVDFRLLVGQDSSP